MGLQRNRSDFDVAETQAGQALERAPILVVTGGQSYWILELEAEGFDLQPGVYQFKLRTQEAPNEGNPTAPPEERQGEVVRRLRVQTEEPRANQGVC